MGTNFINLTQGSPEWLAWRLGGIGASEAAAVIGVCKYKTPYQLFLEKTGRVQGFKGNAATEAGHAMEPKARATYEIEHDFVTMEPACVEHNRHPEIRASLDGISEDRKIILEIKYPSNDSHEMAKAGKVPEHYYPQCQHQLMCVPEAEELHYLSFREERGVTVIVKPDLAYQKMLLEAELAFLDLIKTNTPPPLTEKDALLVDDDMSKAICAELVSLKDESSKPSKELSDKLKAQLLQHCNHPRVRCGNVLITKSITKSGKPSFRMTVSGALE
jgi:putative phage-type endonuclease